MDFTIIFKGFLSDTVNTNINEFKDYKILSSLPITGENKVGHNELFHKSNKLDKNNIRLKVIGNLIRFPTKIQNLLATSQQRTKKNTKLQLNLALNYGSKDEIIRAIKIIKNKKYEVNEKMLNKFLYTFGIPDPDILIRTGDTCRLSNFLLWQLAYTEIFFVKKMWPDFTKNDYKKILSKFKKTRRNFGNI